MKKSQKGSVNVILVLIIVILLGLVGYFVLVKKPVTNVTTTTTTTTTTNSTPTVDFKINGSDGPVTVSRGNSVTFSWETTGEVTGCVLNTGELGVVNAVNGLNGTFQTKNLNLSGSFTPTILCDGGVQDSVVLNVN